jgi:hypothetical protein
MNVLGRRIQNWKKSKANRTNALLARRSGLNRGVIRNATSSRQSQINTVIAIAEAMYDTREEQREALLECFPKLKDVFG